MGDLGSDCADGEIVSDMEDCRAAAKKLGRNFGGSFTPWYSDITCIRPKGCYYLNDKDKYGNVYFNYDTELPAIYQTDLCDTRSISQFTGGICKPGTSYINSM